MTLYQLPSWVGLGGALAAVVCAYRAPWELAFALALVTLGCVLLMALAGPREKKSPSASLLLTEGPDCAGRLMRPLLCHLSYAAENRVDSRNRFAIIPPSEIQQ